jgi:hypothetical protein
MTDDTKQEREEVADKWIDLNTWHVLRRRSCTLLDEAEYLQRRGQRTKAKQVWLELGPLNRYLRSVKVRGLDFDNGKESK